MKYFVYILESKSVGKFYIGSTDDLEKRVGFHNGPYARWTKRFQPWVLRHSEEFVSRSEAVKREKELKRLKNTRSFLETHNL